MKKILLILCLFFISFLVKSQNTVKKFIKLTHYETGKSEIIAIDGIQRVLDVGDYRVILFKNENINSLGVKETAEQIWCALKELPEKLDTHTSAKPGDGLKK